MLGIKPTTSQDKLKQLHSQCQKKKVWITIPNLVPFSNYLQVLFPSNFCQLLTSHLLVRLWLCLLSDLTGYRVLWGEGEGVWGVLDISWKHGIRHSCHDYFCHQTIYYWCAKVLKSFFWVMSFLYCLRKDPTIPCAGLTKVAGCRWKLLSTWLVSASYSAWRFFTDGIF